MITAKNRMSAPAESPDELKQYVNSLIRSSQREPCTVWTMADFSLVTDRVTIVPFTCDHMIAAFTKHANPGISLKNSQSTRVLKLVGDATHDETGQHLKVLRIGVVGLSFCARRVEHDHHSRHGLYLS